MNKVLKVGIGTVQEQRARSLAVAAGTCIRDAAENMALLKVARDQQPDSMVTLARDCIQFAMYL